MPATPAETDPSVCYRHPDRTSWTLCARCGRTICPECQILTPSGVRCPDCVREAGGSVQWQPATPRPAKAKKTGMRRSRSANLADRVSGSGLPVATLTIAGIAVVLWIAGFVTSNLPALALAALPEYSWQVWRLVTSSVVYPAIGAGVIGTIFSIGIFVYIAWGAEKQFGRRRFLEIFLLSSAAGAALSLLIGGGNVGLSAPIWGIAGAYVVEVWNHAAIRNRLLISLAIWFVISLFLGGNIIAIIGGAAAGVGSTLLFRYYADRTSSRRNPWLILIGAIAVLTLLAILRNSVLV